MATWKCDRCGKEHSGWIVDTVVEYTDEAGTHKERICPDCVESQRIGRATTPEAVPGFLARCEQHLRVIKGILIAGAAYLIVKELIVLLIALSK